MKKTELFMIRKAYPTIDMQSAEFVYVKNNTKILRLPSGEYLNLYKFAYLITSIRYATIIIGYDEPSNTIFVGKDTYKEMEL